MFLLKKISLIFKNKNLYSVLPINNILLKFMKSFFTHLNLTSAELTDLEALAVENKKYYEEDSKWFVKANYQNEIQIRNRWLKSIGRITSCSFPRWL